MRPHNIDLNFNNRNIVRNDIQLMNIPQIINKKAAEAYINLCYKKLLQQHNAKIKYELFIKYFNILLIDQLRTGYI